MLISSLAKMYHMKNVIFFEGKLYERLSPHMYRYKYRVILSQDDYDYVANPALRKRLDRRFKAEEKAI